MKTDTRSTSIYKVALKQVRAFAGKCFMGGGGKDTDDRLKLVFTSAVMLAALVSRSAISSPLSDAVNANEAEITEVSTETIDVSKNASPPIKNYPLTNAGACALLVVGVSSGSSVPISFIPGPIPISGLQGDIIESPDLMAMGITITPGPVALNAGKTVSSSPITNGERFIVVGFNQSPLGSGVIANAAIDTSMAVAGPHMLALVNFTASSPAGNTVPMCVTTGVITK
jgi:hypothetical protein